NLANRVTLLRLVFALVSFIFLLLIQEDIWVTQWRVQAAWIAIVFFIVATASDALDGYLARRDNTVTAFGRIADPFVDKVIVCGSIVFLSCIPETAAYLRPWMVALILIREFLVNGIRSYMESIGVSFAAEMPGKIKMVLQSLLIGFLMGVIAFGPEPPAWIHLASVLLLWSTLALTVYSGCLYVVKAGRELGSTEI
ncbi:MAG: CDP-diacylglycerol--glycerol-3-phosphate 3-phosphatidyltransferase, partial [Planctomycetes bacterium]|nr:CDP-diacylglycerol--glycerol-3-phosphate 3-phosphatidyltransferase [Planctomycetota bacterium]